MKIPLEKIEIDDKYYPRTIPDWMTIQRYADAMESGIEFPHVCVVKTGDHYLLLDGRHRYEAAKKVGKATIYAVVKLVPKKDWFRVALELNIANGKPLSMQERLIAAKRLMDEGVSRKDTSRIIHIPVEKLTKYLMDRAIKSPTGAEFILKGTLKTTSGRPQSAQEQATLTVASPRVLFVQAQQLLEHGLIDLTDQAIIPILIDVSNRLNALLAQSCIRLTTD